MWGCVVWNAVSLCKRSQLHSQYAPIRSWTDTGAGLYGCQTSCDLFGLAKEDLIDQVQAIITVGGFCTLAAGGQIIFT
jgi:peroxiredoxin family protein